MLRNISHRFILLSFLWTFLLIQSAIIPFFYARGLAPEQVFTVQSVFILVLALFDVPTGWFADRFGFRRSLILGSALKAAGGLWLAMAHGFQNILVAYILIGLANSFYSGSDIGLAFQFTEAGKGRSKYFSLRVFAVQAGAVCSAVLSSFIVVYSLDWAAWLNGIFATLPLLICFTLPEDRRKDSVPRANKWRLRDLPTLRSSKNVSLFFVTAGLGSVPIFYLFFFQTLLVQWQVSVGSMAWVISCGTILAAVFSLKIHALEVRFPKALRWLPAPFLATVFTLPVFLKKVQQPYLLIGLMFICFVMAEAIRSVHQGLYVKILNEKWQNENRATINSVLSFTSRIFAAALSTGFAHLLKNEGISRALFLPLGAYGLLIAFIIFWLFRAKDPDDL